MSEKYGLFPEIGDDTEEVSIIVVPGRDHHPESHLLPGYCTVLPSAFLHIRIRYASE